MNSNVFCASAVTTIGELLRSRYCEDAGVRLVTNSMTTYEFRNLAGEIVRTFNAKLRRFCGDQLEMVFGCFDDLYLMVTADYVSDDRVRVEILIREDLLDFGEGCDSVEELHNLLC